MTALINSGLCPNFHTDSAGHEYSSEAVKCEAELSADKDQASRAHDLMEQRHGIFATACSEAGYKAGTLRRALGVETDRERVLTILRLNGVTYPGAADQLANAWAHELRSDAGLLQIAAE